MAVGLFLAQPVVSALLGMVLALICLVVGIMMLVAFTLLGLWGYYFRLDLHARKLGAPIGVFRLMGMSLRRINARVVSQAYARGRQAGVALELDQLEKHYLAGGRVEAVVAKLIDARKLDISMDWETACAKDLAEINARATGSPG